MAIDHFCHVMLTSTLTSSKKLIHTELLDSEAAVSLMPLQPNTLLLPQAAPALHSFMDIYFEVL